MTGTTFPTGVVDGSSYFYDNKVCVYRQANNTWECRTDTTDGTTNTFVQDPGTEITSQDIRTLRDDTGNLREKILANLAAKGITQNVPALDTQYEYNHYLAGVLFEGSSPTPVTTNNGDIDLSGYALKSEITLAGIAVDAKFDMLKSAIQEATDFDTLKVRLLAVLQ